MTFGLRPRELTGIVLVQGSVIAVLALLPGIPFGTVLARSAWAAAARSLGVADGVAALSPAQLVLLAAVVVGTTLVLAAAPGCAAAHTRPATTLRSE